MDIKLQEITLPTFLWYVIPGLNFIFLDLLFPLIMVKPNLLTSLQSVGGILAILILSIIIGFIMDSMKLYQFTIGYASRRDVSFNEMAEKLGSDKEMVRTIFEAVKIGIPEKGNFGKALAFEHSRCVMINHTSKCFFLLGIIWAVISILAAKSNQLLYYQSEIGVEGFWVALMVNSIILVLILLIGIRLRTNSVKLHLDIGKKYVYYFEKHKEELMKGEF